MALSDVQSPEMKMLPSQRALFDIPRDLCYLNAAGWSPLPLAVQEVGKIGVARKGQPWTIDAKFAAAQYERARAAAATLIGADTSDIALVPSVSYGVAVAGKVFRPAKGSRVLVLENDHASIALEWHTRSHSEDFSVETVAQPVNGDWTMAVLDAICRPGALPLSLASISSVHWSDGGVIDLFQVRDALRMRGAALIVDATQAIGVIPMDVVELDPDFLVFPTYKWVLGPYGRAFLYVAKRHQNGIPLEQSSYGRRNVVAENAVYFTDMRYLPDARRYDMGERDHFITMEMAATGMEMLSAWGSEAVRARLAMLTRRLVHGLAGSGLAGKGVSVLDEHLRAPHILCLTFSDAPPQDLVSQLASEQIYVALRLGRVRVSPHVYNDEADIDRFIAILAQILAQ